MKKYIIISFLLFFLDQSVAQKQGNIWYFGNNAGLDFNSSTPTPLSGSLYAADNSSAISDSAGNLLFYTNGENIWNSTNAVMVNGSGLMGNGDAGQSSLIIQQPNSSLYYVFTVDYIAGPNGLRYSIVDMNLQGGLGEVTQKNILLYAPTTEKLAAIYNCSAEKYWLITHKWNSADFYVYEINSSGLVAAPVISTVGATHTGGGTGVNNACGQMSISKDGTKLAAARYTAGEIELFDFDPDSGKVKNAQTMTGYSSAWGVEFSPNASKLYLTQITHNTIRQFDLNAGTIGDIMNSEVLVGNTSALSPYYNGTLQLGPDNKLYCSKWNSHYLAVINNPDLQGALCNFADSGVYIGATATCLAGLTRCIVPECNLTSIDDQGFSLVNLFPNPSSGEVNFNLPYKEKLQLQIFNNAGELVFAKYLMGETSLDLHSLQNGIYHAVFSTPTEFYSSKLVLMH
jgi:hypothetical protein